MIHRIRHCCTLPQIAAALLAILTGMFLGVLLALVFIAILW